MKRLLGVLGILVALTGGAGASQPVSLRSVDFMEIVVLVENHPFDGLQSPWGLSIAVRLPHKCFLLDTGPSPEALLHNAEKLGVNLKAVSFVVISHQHYDHVGGLPAVAKEAGAIPVYLPAKASASTVKEVKGLGFDVRLVSESREISEGVGVVGEIFGPPYEEAVAVNVKGKGLVVLVGCSHPGVDRMVHKARSVFGVPVYAVIGGFHMVGKSKRKVKEVLENLLKMGVQKIGALHCSGDFTRSFLQDNYPEHALEMHVGSRWRVGE